MRRIWNSFSEVKRNYDYVGSSIKCAKEYALKYMVAYVSEIHSVGVMLGDKPVLLTLQENEPVYYTKIGQFGKVSDLGIESIYDLCQQLKQQHLVKEWGDPDFDDNEPAQV